MGNEKISYLDIDVKRIKFGKQSKQCRIKLGNESINYLPNKLDELSFIGISTKLIQNGRSYLPK